MDGKIDMLLVVLEECLSGGASKVIDVWRDDQS